MNNDRRKALAAIRAKLEQLQSLVAEAVSELEPLKDEEQDYFDNMPEAFQEAERGEKAQAAIDALDNALSALDEADTGLAEAVQELETAEE